MTIEHWFLFVVADISLYVAASMIIRAIDRNTEAIRERKQ